MRGQRLYAHQSLIDKRNTMDFVKCDHDVQMKIKRLWGGEGNEWFDFYNTIGGGINTHLYFPDDWFYDYVDAKLNDWKRCPIVDDKAFYDFIFTISKGQTLWPVVIWDNG